MVAAGTPHAVAAGTRILAEGGNAVDAAAATAFALMVTDPPMTSLGGRAQILIALVNGRVAGIDGATEAPQGVPPLANEKEERAGYQIAPVPGNPAALALAVRKCGRLPLARVLQPAIDLAQNGFAVTPRVAELWANSAERLRRNPAAARLYLKVDGSAYGAGEIYRNVALAATLRRMAEKGVEDFYRGEPGTAIARDISTNGGYVQPADLRNYKALASTVHRTTYRGYPVAAVGRRAWGGTLMEMLNILENFPFSANSPAAEDVELLARVIAQAIADRPQEVGTLRPKQNAIPYKKLSSREFARERAALIREQMARPQPAQPANGAEMRDAADTTHLAVIDAEGNAVSLTTSIGPHFGSGVAHPELGFLYAHSYRMRSQPTPRMRDETEMTPTIVFRDGKPFLAVGAAGGERIPGAILQVIHNVVDRKLRLGEAVAAPRVHCAGNRVRLDSRFPTEFVSFLKRRGFEVESLAPTTLRHIGVAHAVMFDARTREFWGAADAVYDGAAAAPRP